MNKIFLSIALSLTVNLNIEATTIKFFNKTGQPTIWVGIKDKELWEIKDEHVMSDWSIQNIYWKMSAQDQISTEKIDWGFFDVGHVYIYPNRIEVTSAAGELKKAFSFVKEGVDQFFGHIDETVKRLVREAGSKVIHPEQFQQIADHALLNQATIVGSHNSFAAIAYNYFHAIQDISIPDQLKMGVRSLDLRAYDYEGKIRLCHNDCSAAYQSILKPDKKFTPLSDVLRDVKKFLEQPNSEDIILLWIGGIGTHGIGTDAFKTILKDTNIESLVLKPSDWDPEFRGRWPTYGELRSLKKQVVIFSSYRTEYNYESSYLREYYWQRYPTNNLSFLSYSLALNATTTDYNVGYALSGIADVRADLRNSILIEEFVRELIKKGSQEKDLTLWKGLYPTIIGGDSVGQGNLIGLANKLNEERGLLKPPYGSYKNSCIRCTFNNNILGCLCDNQKVGWANTDGTGNWTTVTLSDTCKKVKNENGTLQLDCLPSGSYKNSCIRCTFNNNVLGCLCDNQKIGWANTDGTGNWTTVTLSDHCKKVKNEHGTLKLDC
jgi:hypothetical protein